MFQQYYQGNEWLTFPLVALVFFFAFFLIVLARVVLSGRDSRRTDALARIPFEDGTASTNEEHHDVRD